MKYKLTGEHFYKFFQCPHWIWYDLYEDKQKKGETPALMQMIRRDGLLHEKDVIAKRGGFEEVKPELFRDLDEAFLATLELMKQGKNIYHGVLMDSHWVGIPDLLEARPVEPAGRSGGKGMTSVFGDHYYVVYDIKSGLPTKSGPEIKEEYKFQLTFYSLILERIQGVLPKEAYIVNGSGDEGSFKVDDFLDYFHFTRERIEEILDGQKPPPFLKSSCKQSPWFSLCLENAKSCSDISLISRLSQSDQRRLYDLGIQTIHDMTSANLEDLRSKLEDWPFDKILRFQSQANVLVSNEPMILKRHEFPAVDTEIYFDIESDPTKEIDYLLGVLKRNKDGSTEYKAFFAEGKKDEERIWREFLDYLDALEDRFVIYHYSQYEKAVFDRFANKYGISLTLDAKFKDHAFDLQKIMTDSVILPLYFYSLKDVGKYLGFKWNDENAGGAESIVWYDEYVANKKLELRSKLLQYNEDDVRATLFIKDWLSKQKPKTKREKPD